MNLLRDLPARRALGELNRFDRRVEVGTAHDRKEAHMIAIDFETGIEDAWCNVAFALILVIMFGVGGTKAAQDEFWPGVFARLRGGRDAAPERADA